MWESLVQPILRHTMQAVGAYWVTSGAVAQSDVDVVIGALLSIAAVGWGICKRKGIKLCQHY